MNENFEKIDDFTFLYRPKNKHGPIALDINPHKESKKDNVREKSYLKKVKK